MGGKLNFEELVIQECLATGSANRSPADLSKASVVTLYASGNPRFMETSREQRYLEAEGDGPPNS